MTRQAKLEKVIARRRAKLEALRSHTPEECRLCTRERDDEHSARWRPHKLGECGVWDRAELRLVRNEARLASLRGQEHLYCRPLVAEPIAGHDARVETTGDSMNAIVTFGTWSLDVTDDYEERKIDRIQLVFGAAMHVAVTLDFDGQHLGGHCGRGYSRRFSFYEVRGSPLVPEVQNSAKVSSLKHWVFYLAAMRIEVVGGNVQHGSGIKSLAAVEQ